MNYSNDKIKHFFLISIHYYSIFNITEYRFRDIPSHQLGKRPLLVCLIILYLIETLKKNTAFFNNYTYIFVKNQNFWLVEKNDLWTPSDSARIRKF